MRPPSATEEVSTPAVLPQLYPLDEFYAHARLTLPRIEIVSGDQVPEPFKQLLVHQGDMTPTLEDFYKSEIHLEVLKQERRGDSYNREVILRTTENKAVEFGAIKIFLSVILAEKFPLGHILAIHRIEHLSRPKAYLKIQSDEFMGRALGLNKPAVLYGRRNTLSTLEMHPLAEIVEILPPNQS
jgi:chorismate-pyruvate lyase